MSGPSKRRTDFDYAGLGIQLVVSVGLAYWLGNKLDQKLGLSIPLFIILLPLGCAGILLYALIKKTAEPPASPPSNDSAKSESSMPT